jgi:5'-nucleotidase
VALDDSNVDRGESVIGNWATEVLRSAAGAHVFFATASGFRAGLPPGPIDREAFLQAFPYPNRIRLATLTGAQVLEWLERSESQAGTGGYSQQSGLRFERRRGQPWRVQILADPKRREAGFAPVDPDGRYLVATTDYQAENADGYREIFAAGRPEAGPEASVHEALLEALATGPAAAACDGRSGPASCR